MLTRSPQMHLSNSTLKSKAKINVPYLVYTSTEDEVSFLIPLECKYRTFMLTQSTGQVTWKYEEKKQRNISPIRASLQSYDVEVGKSLTVFCPYSSKAII